MNEDLSNIQTTQDLPLNTKKQINIKYIYLFFSVLFVFFLYFIFFKAPTDFPIGSVIKIEQGGSLHRVSLELKNKKVIKSSTLFEAFVIFNGGEKHIIYSDYLFEKKLNVYEIAKRISNGEHHMLPVAITIPEGFNTTQISNLGVSKLSNFSKINFLNKTQDLEGYLFPDTYFFTSVDNEDDLIKSMSENFNKKMKINFPQIVRGSKKEKDLIVLASIVEREAKGNNDRDVIAGILIKRLSIGMPLQVDAAPETYKTKGLPKSPICNPGILAIQATLNPKTSAYLYYLHDKNGDIHYAKTFSEHVKNKLKYLK